MKLQLQVRDDFKRQCSLFRYVHPRTRKVVSPVFDNYGKAEKFKEEWEKKRGGKKTAIPD